MAWRVLTVPALCFVPLLPPSPQAIISGIIIDAFGEKRNQRDALEADKRDTDFVSGLARSEFESVNLDFNEWRLKHHAVRSYLYFAIRLDTMDHGDYTGVESYISDSIQANDPCFFPVQRSAVLNTARRRRAEESEAVFGLTLDQSAEAGEAGLAGAGAHSGDARVGRETAELHTAVQILRAVGKTQGELLRLGRLAADEGAKPGAADLFEALWYEVDKDKNDILSSSEMNELCVRLVQMCHAQQLECAAGLQHALSVDDANRQY